MKSLIAVAPAVVLLTACAGGAAPQAIETVTVTQTTIPVASTSTSPAGTTDINGIVNVCNAYRGFVNRLTGVQISNPSESAILLAQMKRDLLEISQGFASTIDTATLAAAALVEQIANDAGDASDDMVLLVGGTVTKQFAVQAIQKMTTDQQAMQSACKIAGAPL